MTFFAIKPKRFAMFFVIKRNLRIKLVHVFRESDQIPRSEDQCAHGQQENENDF